MMRTYDEVYDMNTAVDEMTMLAIHTPQAIQLKKMFKGHFLNYKKYKILGCDIKMACASTLPLSPDQVGLEAGEVDPRDVMNPMLFKACTGDNLNALLNQIYNRGTEAADTTGATECSVGEHIIDDTASRKTYYQLLSDPTWRKAHPQAGIVIRNLKPYVHKVATTQPFKYVGLKGTANSATAYTTDRPLGIGAADPSSSSAMGGFGAPSGTELVPLGTTGPTSQTWDATNPSVFVSNGIAPMPWLDTAVPQQKTVTATGSNPGNSDVEWFINNVPRVYMGCLIMPPAVSTKFYMRMIISWRIAFKDWRPAYEIGGINQLNISDNENGMFPNQESNWTTYFNFYHDTSTKATIEENGTQVKDESSFTSDGLDNSAMVYAS